MRRILVALPLVLLPGLACAQSNPAPIPRTCAATAVATGGTAVTAVTGPINNGFITNPPNAAAQGIVTAENMYIDLINSPGHTDAAGNGTTTILVPGQTFSLGQLGIGVTVKINAATSSHAFTCQIQ